MNNQELELKVKEILAIENFFDMMETAVAFEKEYKTTDFFKKTKMSLMEVIKGSKAWYSLRFQSFAKAIQNTIDNLNLSNLSEIFNQIGDIYGKENAEVLSMIKEFQELVK
jgi:hypothetical protein